MVVLVIFVVAAIIIWNLLGKRKLMKKLLEVDGVTGLMTQYKFNEEARKTLKTASTNEYMLISIDIDNFKYLNELYGYKMGTNTLKIFAENLKESLPRDTSMARIIADEFVVLTKAIDSKILKDTMEFGAKGKLAEDNKFSLEGFLHVSIGVYYITNPELELRAMIDFASIARKNAKSVFGHSITIYTEQMEEKRKVNNTIRSEERRVGKEC